MINLLQTMLLEKSSDLHISAGAPPCFRVNGAIVRSKIPALNPDQTRELCYSMLNEQQIKEFEKNKEIDFSFSVKEVARIRANFFLQRGSVAGVFRKINNRIPRVHDLGFNRYVLSNIFKPHGLVLVTGPTGSGKSTSIASFIEEINLTKKKHIITIEDPIEYTFKHKKSLINQREIGTDTKDFPTALRQVLREDPDVIVVGEIRDRETCESALKAAETGHLVFSTLHTNGAVNTIHRIIQMFDEKNQAYVRNLLSFTLQGVISQVLCQTKQKTSRKLCYEFLNITPAIRNLIREDKLHQVQGMMEVGKTKYGMVLLNEELVKAYQSGWISQEEAFEKSPDIVELGKMMTHLGVA